ncbi:MAG: GNAT family N-acetyltransferase [Solirubrobacterales bacterium]|nr:GNAT family N-acetyltransferase [Solirubrobacterales bacterium]
MPWSSALRYAARMQLRPATREEFDAFSRVALSAFHRELSDVARERYQRIGEPERSLAWFDDGRIVATTGAFTRRLTVPGGEVACAAVTAVAVAPTHRRRGLLTAMTRRQLADVRDRGEPVAILWASEGGIYGRFGYGIATRAAHLVAGRPAARVAAPPEPDELLRAGPAGEHVEAMRLVHDRVRLTRAGMLDRRGPWWQDNLHDPEADRDGGQPLQAVVVGGGYALYSVKPQFDADDLPSGEVRVRELIARTPAARATLWSFLLDQDLTASTTWDLAPLDDPLPLMLSDPRAVRVSEVEGLWARIIDVGGALAAREYGSQLDPELVLEVTDAFCPWNEGRWRVTREGCARTDAAPDLALGVADLGAAYLGGTTLVELADAGRVRELRPGGLARGSAAFRGEVEPWCPETF